MSDWATISSMATAGGTLVLAIATFSSIRSANASARVAERALLAAQRPVLIPSRDDDPVEQVRFGDGMILRVPGHGGIAKRKEDNLYFAFAVRNGGAGVAVIHSWHVVVDYDSRLERPDGSDGFRRQARDLYITSGSPGFWQGAIRDRDHPHYDRICARMEAGERVYVDVVYGDHEGGQRQIARFSVPSRKDEELGARIEVLRYWNLDGEDPR